MLTVAIEADRAGEAGRVFSGKSSNGISCTWAPIANGTFTCDMAPYPGNEVD